MPIKWHPTCRGSIMYTPSVCDAMYGSGDFVVIDQVNGHFYFLLVWVSWALPWAQLYVTDKWIPLQRRHYGHYGVSNHQPHDCLLNRLFRRRKKITSRLRVTGFCAGNSPVTGEFPTQRASNAEKVFIWWRNHDHRWSQFRCVLPYVRNNLPTTFTNTTEQSLWTILRYDTMKPEHMAASLLTTFSCTIAWMNSIYS